MSENLPTVEESMYITLYVFQLNKILKGKYLPYALIAGRV